MNSIGSRRLGREEEQMTIIRAAVGNSVRDFEEGSRLEDVWSFIDGHMAVADDERAIVLMDGDGSTLGFIWEKSLYFALFSTPEKMRSYLELCNFGVGGNAEC